MQRTSKNSALAPQVKTTFRDAQNSITRYDEAHGKYLYRSANGKYRVIHDHQSRGGLLRGLLDRSRIKRTNDQMRESAVRILNTGSHNPEVVAAADFFLRRDCTEMGITDYLVHLAVLARAEAERDTPPPQKPARPVPAKPLPLLKAESPLLREQKPDVVSRERIQSNWTRGTPTKEPIKSIDDILDGWDE